MENSYSEIFFNKGFKDIVFSDIESFFQIEQEESDIIEFKSGETSLESIFSEVCAFLNTNGGVLIIGAPKENDNNNKRTCMGELTHCSHRSRDWLFQKIASSIQPSPSGIYIKELSNESTRIFYCEIQQSINPPHQSTNGVYYMRIGSLSVPAPHGIVQALFNKRKKPDLKSSLEIIVKSQEISGFNQSSLPLIHNCKITFQNKNKVSTDEVHYLVEVYNAKSVVLNPSGAGFGKTLDDDFLKATHLGKINIPMIWPIRQIVEFSVSPYNNRNYVISILYWSKEVDLDINYWLLNCQTGQIESFGNSFDSEITLSMLLDKIRH